MTMNLLSSLLVLLATFLAVFCESAFNGVRHILGAQIDLLPALVVYASLTTGLATVGLVACLGGLWFDSLSANALGVSVLPLFLIGLGIYSKRDLILREQVFAQLALGLAASALAPALTMLLLLTFGHTPLFGWGSLWQWIVMSVGGAVATPVCFVLLSGLNRMFVHGGDVQSSFRPDREIRRGRK